MSERENSSSYSFTASRLFSSELLCWSKSDDISEVVLRQIIRRYRNHDKNNNFHARCHYEFIQWAFCSEKITEGIVRLLLEYFPAAVDIADEKGWLPIHYACDNKNVSIGIIQLLIDAAPDSVRSVNYAGLLPIHKLCGNNTELDGTEAIRILSILLEKYPGSERIADVVGKLPFHYACL